jgi:serine/threonine-protein kinase
MTQDPAHSADDARAGEWASGLRRRRFGQRLGRYCLGALVGSGGAASVYMARLDGPRGFERELALKIVHEHLLADRDFVAMFLDEANLASQLQHPNIVHSYELCQDQDSLCLAMEYLQGQPLSRVYRRALRKNQPLPYALIAWIGARAGDALAYAHDMTDTEGEPLRLVHRDVSPDNLFITYDGQVKLLDFGIARAARRLAQTNLGQIKGKLRYMAPEYALGQEFDGAVDVFALGATLYEAAVGKPAFEGEEQEALHRSLRGELRDPRQERGDFPNDLWRVLRATLDPDPSTRLGPAAKVARELDAQAGLSSAQGRALLALTMDRLFGAERAADVEDVAELRGLPRLLDERTEHSHVLTGTHGGAQRKPRTLLFLGMLVLLAAAALFVPRQRAAQRGQATGALPAAVSATPAPLSSVDIGVAVTPPGIIGVVIDIAGVPQTGANAHRLVARSDVPLPIRIRAPGYLALELTVVPERDQSLVLALTPEPRPAKAASVKPAKIDAAKPAPSPSGVITRYPF